MKDIKNRTVITVITLILLIFMLALMQGSWSGKALFKSEGCINCHSFRGQGGALGPDLTAVSGRRSTLWIIKQIRNPKGHNPDSMMPEHSNLSIIEIFAITVYLKS